MVKLQEIENALLYIEPDEEKKHTPEKIIEYKWLQDLFEKAIPGACLDNGKFTCDGFMGVHTCRCGAHSESRDYLFPNYMYTNTLFMHYLEWHFHEIPAIEFVKLEQLKNNVEFKQCSSKRCRKYSSTIIGKYKRCKKCRNKSKKK